MPAIGTAIRTFVVAAVVASGAAALPQNDPAAPAGTKAEPELGTKAAVETEAKPDKAKAQTKDGYLAYGDHDLHRALRVTTGDDGEEQHGIDLDYLDLVIADLARHAQSYPPRFETDEERARAERDARSAASLLAIFARGDEAEPQVLLRAGRVSAIAHNLDIQGAGDQATDYFERLLRQEPENGQGHWHYGAFLAATAVPQKQEDGVKHLERALALGIEEARFSLGIAHLMLGNQAKALEYLKEYSRTNPDHARAKALIEAIAAGKVKKETRQR